MLSTLFGAAALVYTVVAAITAFNSMLHYGTAREAAPTLMIVAPILTVLGIMALRQSHGLHTTFGGNASDANTLMLLTRIIAVQLLFAGLGVLVLRQQGYMARFVFGNRTSPGAYALICPGVALNVMAMFWLHKGLVANGILARFGAGYWGIVVLAIALQLATIALLLYLNRRHFGRAQGATLQPAE